MNNTKAVEGRQMSTSCFISKFLNDKWWKIECGNPWFFLMVIPQNYKNTAKIELKQQRKELKGSCWKAILNLPLLMAPCVRVTLQHHCDKTTPNIPNLNCVFMSSVPEAETANWEISHPFPPSYCQQTAKCCEVGAGGGWQQ